MRLDPAGTIALRSSMAKETPFNKVDPSNFTPESLGTFSRTRNYADLVPRNKLENSNGVWVDPYSGQTVRVGPQDPNKPFGYGADGKVTPNDAFQRYELSRTRAGAPSVTVKNEVKTGESIAGQIGPMVKDSYTAAQGAVQTATAADQVLRSIQAGNLVTGPLAGQRIKGLQIAEAMGIGGRDATERLTNTRSAVQGLAQMTLQGRKQMSGQGAVTESESKLTVNSDRSGVVGSGDWILKQARKTSGGRLMVDPSNPEYEGGYLQGAGSSLAGGVVGPRSLPQLAHQAGLSIASASAGKAVGDLTDNPALAITASLTPAAAQLAATQAVRGAVRGGERGRQQMRQRTQDLKNAGVDNPTLGLATGNQVIGGLENLLQNTPGAVGTMSRSRDAAIQGLRDKTANAAEAASPVRGSLESGQAIQSGIRGFRDTFKAKQGDLYARLDEHIDPMAPVDVTRTRQTLAALNEDIPGAPELSKQFKNGRIQAIEQAMASDTAGSPPTVMVYGRPPVGGGGIMNPPVNVPPVVVQVPAGPPTNRLPFQAVRKTRTLVGNEIADTNLTSSVPRSKWSPLYGALADDMQAAADAAGPKAAGAYKRANDFTRSGLNRLDRVQPFVSPDAPEQSFQLLRRTLGENASTLQAVKKTLPQGARGTVAGTVIERLGKANPGQQNATGEAWSPETFLTNWNKMDPKAHVTKCPCSWCVLNG